MEKCEMYKVEKSFTRGELTLCWIGKNSCPYKNGDGGFNSFEDGIWYTICKTHGFVEEKGLIKKVEEIKPTKV